MDGSGLGRHGAFRRKDAIEEFGAYRVRQAQEIGQWQSPWSGVLVEAARATDPLTLMAAAVALGNDGVLVAGPSAAYLHGCRSIPPTPVHVMGAYEHWLRTRPGLVVHSGPSLESDRDVRCGLPVLNLERTLTDLLCTSRPADALAVLDEVLATIDAPRREKYRDEIRQRLAERPDPRGTCRGARLLELGTGCAESPAESWLLYCVVDSGFPVPQANWSLTGPDGREVYRLDLAWPELRIAIEYNGYAVHADQAAADKARIEDLRKRGWTIVVVWAGDLANPGRYEAKLDAAFRSRGVDTSRRCSGVLRGRRHREGPRNRPRLAR